jgi:hypothetical protein
MKLPQLSLQELFLLVALVATLSSPAAAQRPELEAEAFVAEAHEITLEQLYKMFSYHKSRVFLYAGSDKEFDYIWLHHERLGKVTVYRLKLPRGDADLEKRFPLRSARGEELTWAIFPTEWRRPRRQLKPEDPPKKAAVK